MAVQQEIKSQLAKLLATEDIVVEHKQVDEHNKLKLTPELIHNLRDLYRKDIEAFYPELAA